MLTIHNYNYRTGEWFNLTHGPIFIMAHPSYWRSNSKSLIHKNFLNFIKTCYVFIDNNKLKLTTKISKWSMYNVIMNGWNDSDNNNDNDNDNDND